jgi:chemotaxis methyl-accepting protein methylase
VSQPANLPELSVQECLLWQEFIRQRCGLVFSASRQRVLRQSLLARMRLHRLQSFREYYHYVAFHPAAAAEWQALLELLLNHETHFFRHQPSFAALTEHVLPALMQDRSQGSTITMWSAGCSLGQEAYSLAMAFLDLTAPPSSPCYKRRGSWAHADWQVKVIGTDISYQALEKARRGQYKFHETRLLPDHYRQHHFTMLKNGPNVVYQVVPRLRAVVDFHYMNLCDPQSASPVLPPFIGGKGGGVEVIFCQNVLIYFPQEDRSGIVQRLCQFLRPGGYLFLGPAEVLSLRLPGIQPVQLAHVLLYQRNA